MTRLTPERLDRYRRGAWWFRPLVEEIDALRDALSQALDATDDDRYALSEMETAMDVAQARAEQAEKKAAHRLEVLQKTVAAGEMFCRRAETAEAELERLKQVTHE